MALISCLKAQLSEIGINLSDGDIIAAAGDRGGEWMHKSGAIAYFTRKNPLFLMNSCMGHISWSMVSLLMHHSSSPLGSHMKDDVNNIVKYLREQNRVLKLEAARLEAEDIDPWSVEHKGIQLSIPGKFIQTRVTSVTAGVDYIIKNYHNIATALIAEQTRPQDPEAAHALQGGTYTRSKHKLLIQNTESSHNKIVCTLHGLVVIYIN